MMREKTPFARSFEGEFYKCALFLTIDLKRKQKTKEKKHWNNSLQTLSSNLKSIVSSHYFTSFLTDGRAPA